MRRRESDPQKQALYNWESRTVRAIDPSTPVLASTKREIKSRKYVRITQPNGYTRVINRRDVGQYVTQTDPPTRVDTYLKPKWERVIVSGGIDAAEAQAFADTVCAAFGRHPVKVTITKRLRAHSYFNGWRGIRLAAGWGQTYTVLAHELAHAVCERMRFGLDIAAHGPEFARVLAVILSRYVTLSGQRSTEAEIVASMRSARLAVADEGYPHTLADAPAVAANATGQNGNT